QIKSLRSGAQIVVATPGRLIDHLDRGTIQLNGVHTVVLDEADEMISMGFKEDLESILEKMTEIPHQTWLFSATMSKEVRRVADQFLNDPKTVQVNRTEMLSGTVKQIYYMTREMDKPDVLCKLIDMNDDFYGLIFCQTKLLVTDLTNLLQNRGYKVDCLHGDKPQAERDRILKRFKAKEMTILVCTDVAARGLDVKELTHVINYSIPRELDSYVHRIGRTGRSGKSGTAMSLVTNSHMQLIGRIERLTKTPIERGQIPTRKDVAQKKLDRAIQEVMGVTDFEPVKKMIEAQGLEQFEGVTTTDLLARILTLKHPELFKKLDEREREPQEARPYRPQSRLSAYGEGRGGGYRDRGNGEGYRGRPQGDRREDSDPYRPRFGGGDRDGARAEGGFRRGGDRFGGASRREDGRREDGRREDGRREFADVPRAEGGFPRTGASRGPRRDDVRPDYPPRARRDEGRTARSEDRPFRKAAFSESPDRPPRRKTRSEDSSEPTIRERLRGAKPARKVKSESQEEMG
ncbi:MAG: DEAD/DEAH box helicase, partial [Bdellovibrionales bacterium]|nr:DEAD/DEAH box helicase [Bdellovibrionales bacterium]